MTKALVIGSGFGGLAAAARLRKKGYDVVVLEANDFLGGRARVFERDGFRFDAGPTVITAPYLFDELFELFGIKASVRVHRCKKRRPQALENSTLLTHNLD